MNTITKVLTLTTTLLISFNTLAYINPDINPVEQMDKEKQNQEEQETKLHQEAELSNALHDAQEAKQELRAERGY